MSLPSQARATPRAGGERRPPVPALDFLPGLYAWLEDVPPHGCHWPLGDPKQPGFAFCGRAAGEAVYCPAHATLAYRPRDREGR